MKKSIKLIVAIAATSLVASIAVTPVAHAKTKQKVCVVLDTAGINDKSFNQTSYAGALASKSKGFASSVEYLPSASVADYAPNLKKFVDKKCTLIFGIGFAIGEKIIAAAEANPSVKFAIVDNDGLKNFTTPTANLKGLTFNTDQNSFVAGYLAAGYSKTGKVATYGGAPYPTVTIFMDGFARGVKYYNDVKDKSVKVLGWDPANPGAGTMVGNFDDTNAALRISQNFELQGADVIFPVAGGLGVTSAENSMKTKKSVTIGVDADYNLTAPKVKKVILISVLKGLSQAVEATIKEAHDGKFSNKLYVGTLKNKGVGLSPFYAPFNKSVSKSLQADMKDLAENIASGIVSVTD